MPPKRRAPAKAKAKAAATQPADGLSVGGAAVVAEAGSPYDGQRGIIKKLSLRTAHLVLDDSASHGAAARMMQRSSVRPAPAGGAAARRPPQPEPEPEPEQREDSQLLRIECPAGARAGQLMKTLLPSGEEHEVLVPRTVAPGGSFAVPRPAPAALPAEPAEPALPAEPAEEEAPAPARRPQDAAPRLPPLPLVVGASVAVVAKESRHFGSRGVITKIGRRLSLSPIRWRKRLGPTPPWWRWPFRRTARVIEGHFSDIRFP